MKGNYRCTRCGWSEIDAKRYGCTAGGSSACPMEIRSWWKQLLFTWLEIVPRSLSHESQ